jgi:hypothetical protein
MMDDHHHRPQPATTIVATMTSLSHRQGLATSFATPGSGPLSDQQASHRLFDIPVSPI